MNFSINPLYVQPVNIHVLPPSLIDNKVIAERLEAFCELHCNIDVNTMITNICAGEKIENTIIACDTAEEVEQVFSRMPSAEQKDAVKNLMWLLMAKAAVTDELYKSGSIRLDDPDAKVAAFIRTCGGNHIYKRTSTHMGEYRLHGEKQFGLDLRGLGLPAKKRTLLFDQLPDGSLFLKMEDRGMPPFWKNKFRNFSNFAEFLGHCKNYVITRFDKDATDRWTRREVVPKETRKEFKLLMKQTVGNNAEIKKSIEVGQKFGLSRMDTILEREMENLDEHKDSELIDQIAEFRELHFDALYKAQAKGYNGDVKGREVLLPSLGTTIMVF